MVLWLPLSWAGVKNERGLDVRYREEIEERGVERRETGKGEEKEVSREEREVCCRVKIKMLLSNFYNIGWVVGG